MKRINNPFKIVGVAAMLLLGSGLASAAVPLVFPQGNKATVYASEPSNLQPSPHAAVIRLAWDRVGTMA